jgi:rare lipoprotein A
MNSLKLISILSLVVPLLSGCFGSGGMFSGRDSAPNVRVNYNAVPNAVPRVEPRSKYGNPASYEVNGKRYVTLKSSANFTERGTASWYGTKFHGRRTSSGETYNLYGMTAAHKTLPLPTYVEVTNLDNGLKVIVKVNDRGPFHGGRIIDLSYVAALKLGITKTGTGRVEIRAIDPRTPQTHKITRSASSKKAITKQPQTQARIHTKTIASLPSLFLQVGAFSSRVNAENLRSRINGVSSNPIKISKDANQAGNSNMPVYRVRIGPLPSDQIAQQLVLKLTDLGITNASVVID